MTIAPFYSLSLQREFGCKIVVAVKTSLYTVNNLYCCYCCVWV